MFEYFEISNYLVGFSVGKYNDICKQHVQVIAKTLIEIMYGIILFDVPIIAF